MYYDDHAPAHFHAIYQEHEALIEIGTLQVMKGSLPRRALELVLEWAELHRLELLEDWKLAEQHQALNSISPLE